MVDGAVNEELFETFFRRQQASMLRPWTTEVFELYGKRANKRYKTFEATRRPAGGFIRVVPVDEPGGWLSSPPI